MSGTLFFGWLLMAVGLIACIGLTDTTLTLEQRGEEIRDPIERRKVVRQDYFQILFLTVAALVSFGFGLAFLSI